MTTLPPDDFWRLLRASSLLEDEKLDSLRRRVEKKESIGKSSTKIARVLVANEILTASQARRLLSGKKLKSSAAGPPPSEARMPAPNSNSETHETSAKPTARKKKSRLPLILAATALLFGATAFGLWKLSPPSSPVTDSGKRAPQLPTETAPSVAEKTIDEEPYEYVESETALWGRAATGKSISLSYAPAGVQTTIHIRASELLQHREGSKILRSLGPQLQATWESWLARMRVNQADLAEITLHLSPQGTTLPQVVVVARLKENKSIESVAGFDAKDKQNIAKIATDAVWFPSETESSNATFVFGPEKLVRGIVTDHSEANPVLLRRELEQLRRATHDTDQVTILTNPNFLRDEAQDLFPALRRSLLDGLYEFWSQEAQAVSLGMQLTDVALVEVRMIAREDLPPRRLAGRVQKFVAALPDRTTGHLGRVQLDPYWQPLAMRFPTMLHFLSEQTRIATEGKQVAVNVALPIEGIHNLLLATELSSATPLAEVGATNVVDRSNWTIDDVLQSRTSIRFSQKSLEQAMNDIAEQVRDELKKLPFTFSIELVGADLEPDGITRNQQIRDFAALNVPVSDALTAIVQKANPVQGVTDATNADQKLVWAVGDAGRILITTRSAAKRKGIELPAVFGQ